VVLLFACIVFPTGVVGGQLEIQLDRSGDLFHRSPQAVPPPPKKLKESQVAELLELLADFRLHVTVLQMKGTEFFFVRIDFIQSELGLVK